MMQTIFLAICLSFALSSPAPAVATDETVVMELAANGQRNTRPFTVRDRWELRWDLQGQMLGIMIRDGAGKFVATGGQQDKPGQGTSYQPKGGTYYLEIVGMGDWTVRVVQLP
jgi:hypothetical protein